MVDNPFRACFAFAYEILRDDPLPEIEERADRAVANEDQDAGQAVDVAAHETGDEIAEGEPQASSAAAGSESHPDQAV